jgi:hypothetical protein
MVVPIQSKTLVVSYSPSASENWAGKVFVKTICMILLFSIDLAKTETDAERYGTRQIGGVTVTGKQSAHQKIEEISLREAAEDVYRKFDGKIYDLTPRIYWNNQLIVYGEHLSDTRPLPEWNFIHGKVLQVTSDGILFQKYADGDFEMAGDWRTVLIRNYPHTAVDGWTMSFYVLLDGVHQYTSVQNATKTIVAYNYGLIPSAAEMAHYKTEQKKKFDQLQQKNQTINDQKKTAAAIKALESNQALAEKGDAYGLFRMGERYRDGEGVPKDESKAREYFQKAAAKGHLSAANALKKFEQK